jgi:hypothetical protein
VISIGGIAASGTDYEMTFIGGIYGGEVSTGTALPVYVDTDGHLGTSLVNRSAKKLRTRSPQSARSQAKINEFQKQQKRIAELETTVAPLVATVKEQAAQIEKVSAQLELQKPVQQVVANNKQTRKAQHNCRAFVRRPNRNGASYRRPTSLIHGIRAIRSCLHLNLSLLDELLASWDFEMKRLK